MANAFQVFFKSGTCDLDAALRWLSGYGLTVAKRDGYLTAGRPNSQEFDVGLSAEPWVREEAAEISKGTPHAAAMQGCDARFEVSFESLDEALDEMNTMMEVQVALQEACRGLLFLPWNGSLSGPGA
jgi:hypothetical protein